MPYVVRGKCVYKKDKDGNPGKKVGCTKGSVKKYLAALLRSREGDNHWHTDNILLTRLAVKRPRASSGPQLVSASSSTHPYQRRLWSWLQAKTRGLPLTNASLQRAWSLKRVEKRSFKPLSLYLSNVARAVVFSHASEASGFSVRTFLLVSVFFFRFFE